MLRFHLELEKLTAEWEVGILVFLEAEEEAAAMEEETGEKSKKAFVDASIEGFGTGFREEGSAKGEGDGGQEPKGTICAGSESENRRRRLRRKLRKPRAT